MEYFDPRGGSNRYNIRSNFFQKWSDEMAYVLGFLYADGAIIDATFSSRTQYIKFSNKDKCILYIIKSLLHSEHPLYYRPPSEILGRNGKVYKSSGGFYLRIGNKRMFADLKKIGLVPNKSKIVRFPTLLPEKYLNQFVRGYFDGDGSVKIEYGKGVKEKIIFKRIRTIFTSGSQSFLKTLSSKLSKIADTTSRRVYKGNRCFQLVYSTRDSIKLFKFMYKNSSRVFLKRKFETFEKFFKIRPNWLDKEVAKVLRENKLSKLSSAPYPSS